MSEHHKHTHHRHIVEHAAHRDRQAAELTHVIEHIHSLIHGTLKRHAEEDDKLEARHLAEHEHTHAE